MIGAGKMADFDPVRLETSGERLAKAADLDYSRFPGEAVRQMAERCAKVRRLTLRVNRELCDILGAAS